MRLNIEDRSFTKGMRGTAEMCMQIFDEGERIVHTR